MLLISIFLPGIANSNDDFCSLRPIFIFQTVFLFLHLEQPTAVTDSYSLRIFCPFSRQYFTFSDDMLLLQFLVFVLIDGISGCLGFLGTQPHFKDASCTSQGCCWFPGWQFPGSEAFSPSVFQQTSYSVQYFYPCNQVAFRPAHIKSPLQILWF